MSFKFICEKPLTATQFAECYSNLYFTKCDTFGETKKCLASACIYIGDGWRLSEIDKIPDNTACVLVEFSTDEDYTVYEYRVMRIQKKYLNRFIKNLKNYY